MTLHTYGIPPFHKQNVNDRQACINIRWRFNAQQPQQVMDMSDINVALLITMKYEKPLALKDLDFYFMVKF